MTDDYTIALSTVLPGSLSDTVERDYSFLAEDAEPDRVRRLYARLNAEYDAMPPTEKRRCGSEGDPYPL